MSIEAQVHEKFKVFIGPSISDVAGKVTAFTANGEVAAKSIGIEYVEQTDQFLLSLGYAPGQGGYPVKVTDAIAASLAGDDIESVLETALEQAAEDAGDVICHELYVDRESTVHIVFLIRA